jgi:hypothetical protein
MRPVRIALVLAAAAGALTCGSEPTAGELVGSLETQRTDAEAVRFVIHATPPNEVESVTAACNQCQIHQSLDGPNELRGIVVGSIGAGPAFRALVNDIDAVSGYQVEVIEVADGAYVLLPIGDFRITMGR